MTQPTSPAIPLAYGLQSAKGVAATKFYKTRALQSSLGPADSNQALPPEVGGTYHPGGMYKQFVYGAGTVALRPRLEKSLGILLYALMGDVNAAGSASAGAVGYKTVFQPNPNACATPWLTVRNFIPDCSGSDTEIGQIEDTKVVSARFNIAAGAPMTIELGLMGITPNFDHGITLESEVSDEEYENENSVPYAMTSLRPILTALTGIDIGGELGSTNVLNMPTIGMRITITNTYSGSQPQNEAVVGSYYLDDLVLLSQAMTIEATYKWKDPDLYRAMMRGADPTTWSPKVLNTSFDFTTKSAYEIADGMNPYSLRFYHPSIDWASEPIALSAGGWLTMNLTGVGKATATPAGYASLTLENGVDYAAILGESITYA